MKNTPRLSLSLLFGTLVYLMAPYAVAEEAKAIRISGTEELDQLRAENALLQERVKNFELSNKMNIVPSINGASNPLDSSPIPLSRNVGTGSARTGSGGHGTQVLMVSGQKDRPSATLQTAEGATLVVRTGDTIPGLGRVKSIEANQVLVESSSSKKTVIALSFAASPDLQNSQLGNASMPVPMMGR